MRFMMLIYPGLEQEGDWTPDVEAVAAMGRYNDELTKAGVLLALRRSASVVRGRPHLSQ